MSIEIIFNSREFKNWLSSIEQKQLPYVTAVSLTKLAKEGKEIAKQHLRDRLILRNKYTERSIKYLPAEKRDWPNSEAWVFSISTYLPIHETGGIARAKSGNLAIPFRRNLKVSKYKKIPKSKYTSNLKKTVKATRSGTLGLYKTSGRGRKQKTTLMYILQPSVKIPDRLDIRETLEEFVSSRYYIEFQYQMRKAIKD